MEPKSKLLAEEKGCKKPDYTDEETLYLNRLQMKLERARDMRDSKHDEFDGMSFVEHWQMEEKIANTFIEPKANKSDSNYQSGTMRDKIFDFLSELINLDLSPDIHAFDENEMEITRLGHALEKVIDKTEELDIDDEKKLMRWYELVKHGYVFVEEIWKEKWAFRAKWIKKFEGKIKDVKWKKRLKLIYARPERNILSGLNVYLGDITQYDFNKQPYSFFIKYPSYDEAESVYGKKDADGNSIWERWEYVTRDRQEIAPNSIPSIAYNTWRLTEVQKDSVEEIHYVDPYGKEYAVILNGVLMTPIGMPTPWGYDGYNIAQQNLEPIHPFFAYGKSLVSRKRTAVAILDEMMRIGILKTQKSAFPPRGNLTGRVLSSRVFMPGVITNGLDPKQLPPLDEKDSGGITSSEMVLLSQLQNNISGVNIQGAMKNTKQQTATEILQIQQEAKRALGFVQFAVSMLEYKLSWLRLFNVLENWFNPIDSVVDDARKELVNRYRTVNMKDTIPDKGVGRSIVVPTNKQVTPNEIYDEETQLSTRYNQPVQITVLNPEWLKEAKITWQLTVTPRQKKTNEVSKLMFRAMMQDIQLFGPSVNLPYLQEKFATVWDDDASKLFTKGQPAQPTNAVAGQENQQDQGANGNVPGLPNIDKGMNQAVKNKMIIG